MRILAGIYKGKHISAGHAHCIRPMTNKNKESIFTILDEFFTDHDVLDLFCGSGNLGLESLSRGAAQVTFVDRDRSSLSILNKNIEDLKIEAGRITVNTSDVLSFLIKDHDSYRLIFADPPFKYHQVQAVVDAVFLHKRLDKEGIMVLHHEKTNPIRLNTSLYRILKQKKAGRSLITFLA